MQPTPTIEEIWETYGKRLRRYLASRASNPADVDDVMQEVLLRSHERIVSIRDLSQLRSWLFRVARNALVDQERRVNSRKEVSSVDETLEAAEPPAVPGAHQVDLADCVRPFLGRLDERDRLMLDLVDLQGRSQRAVAAEMELPYSTVKSRIQRARDRLAAELSSCCTVQVLDDGQVLGTPVAASCQGTGDGPSACGPTV